MAEQNNVFEIGDALRKSKITLRRLRHGLIEIECFDRGKSVFTLETDDEGAIKIADGLDKLRENAKP
jgi:hypothetical protein